GNPVCQIDTVKEVEELAPDLQVSPLTREPRQAVILRQRQVNLRETGPTEGVPTEISLNSARYGSRTRRRKIGGAEHALYVIRTAQPSLGMAKCWGIGKVVSVAIQVVVRCRTSRDKDRLRRTTLERG